MSLNLPICHACNTTLSRKQRRNITENVTNPPYLGAQLKKCDHKPSVLTILVQEDRYESWTVCYFHWYQKHTSKPPFDITIKFSLKIGNFVQFYPKLLGNYNLTVFFANYGKEMTVITYIVSFKYIAAILLDWSKNKYCQLATTPPVSLTAYPNSTLK